MKNLKLFLVCTIALSTVAPTYAQRTAKPLINRTWWQKHGAKVRAGIAIAAALGIALAASYHGNKTKKAVDAAHVDSRYYGWAVAIVAALGVLGPNNTIAFFKWATKTNLLGSEEKIVSNKQLASLIATNIDEALARYFYPDSPESRIGFQAELTLLIPVNLLQSAKEAVKEGLREVADEVGAFAASVKGKIGQFVGKSSNHR